MGNYFAQSMMVCCCAGFFNPNGEGSKVSARESRDLSTGTTPAPQPAATARDPRLHTNRRSTTRRLA